MSLILQKKKFFSPQAPEVAQRKLSTNASNTVTLAFDSVPAAGSLLLFFYTNTLSQEDLSASPSGYTNLNAPSPSVDGPKAHTGYVIADGSTNSFTFTTATGAAASLYGFEIVSYSAVSTEGFNFATSTTFVQAGGSADALAFGATNLGFAFVAVGNTFSSLTVDEAYTINLSNSRSGSAEKFYSVAETEDPIFSWVTARQTRSVVIRVRL
jgi:hypothetical protein